MNLHVSWLFLIFMIQQIYTSQNPLDPLRKNLFSPPETQPAATRELQERHGTVKEVQGEAGPAFPNFALYYRYRIVFSVR